MQITLRDLSYFFVFALLCGCTTYESDRTTNYARPIFDTQVNAESLSHKERGEAILWENYYYNKNTEPLKKQLEPLQARRAAMVADLALRFPECKNQKYCASTLTHASIERLEEYNREARKLRWLDFQIVDIESKLADLKEGHEIRVRRLYNRFLVGELSKIKVLQPRIKNIFLHSLQIFPNRGALSRRLLSYADHQIEATQLGDLDFRMLGKPVDEAAILVTIDVHLNETLMHPSDPPRYLITYLVNTHQLDPLEYETDFLKEWSKLLAVPGLQMLRKSVFCGLYTIAGSTLASKMQVSKLAYCRWERTAMQELSANKFEDRFPPERWLLPVSFVQFGPKK